MAHTGIIKIKREVISIYNQRFYLNPKVERKGRELQDKKIPDDLKPFAATYNYYLRKIAEYMENPSPKLRRRIDTLEEELIGYYYELFTEEILDGPDYRANLHRSAQS